LTFWLKEGSFYKLWDKGNVIYLDFKGPDIETVSAPREIEISEVVNVKESGLKTRAAENLLSQFETGPAETAEELPDTNRDILWILAFLLTVVYVLYFRAETWKRFVQGLEGLEKKYVPAEKRKWWRHSLAPLKDKTLHASISSSKSNTKLDLVPQDVGYGGMMFECNRLKKLEGELDINLFMPDKMLPVKLKGVMAWRKDGRNLLRKHIGVSFTTLPEAEWAGVNNYIERQYASLGL
jgi:hypothetical protein